MGSEYTTERTIMQSHFICCQKDFDISGNGVERGCFKDSKKGICGNLYFEPVAVPLYKDAVGMIPLMKMGLIHHKVYDCLISVPWSWKDAPDENGINAF